MRGAPWYNPLGLVAALCAAALAHGALLSKRHEAAKRHEALGGLLSGKHRSGAPRRNETGVVAAAWAAVQDLVASRPAPTAGSAGAGPRAAPGLRRRRLPSACSAPTAGAAGAPPTSAAVASCGASSTSPRIPLGRGPRATEVLSYGAHDDQARARCDAAVFWQVDDAREAAAARRAVGAPRAAARLRAAQGGLRAGRLGEARNRLRLVRRAARSAREAHPPAARARAVVRRAGVAPRSGGPRSRHPRYLFEGSFVATLGTHPARGAWLAAALARRETQPRTPHLHLRPRAHGRRTQRGCSTRPSAASANARARAPCDSEGAKRRAAWRPPSGGASRLRVGLRSRRRA